ncbi:MAG: ADP-ribosyltransferase [Sphingobium sp.]
MRDSYRRTLAFYTGIGGGFINHCLREGDDDGLEYRQQIRDLDEMISKSNLKRDVTLFRGLTPIGSAALREAGLKEGTVFVDDGFISCTTSPDVALRFMRGDGRGDGGLLLAINVPMGFNAIYAAPYAQDPAECEVILPRGTEMVVSGYDPATDLVEMEVLR